jgi:hypothetical protein
VEEYLRNLTELEATFSMEEACRGRVANRFGGNLGFLGFSFSHHKEPKRRIAPKGSQPTPYPFIQSL